MTMIRQIISFLQGIGDVSESIKDSVRDMERRADRAVKRVQKRIMIIIFETGLILLGVLFLLAGIMLFLSRYPSMDIILISGGLLLLYSAFLLRLSHK